MDPKLTRDLLIRETATVGKTPPSHKPGAVAEGRVAGKYNGLRGRGQYREPATHAAVSSARKRVLTCIVAKDRTPGGGDATCQPATERAACDTSVG
jgi:hypothetical protein